jgi:peptidoglycan/LPS O-acetylase OafA/YrhL
MKVLGSIGILVMFLFTMYACTPNLYQFSDIPSFLFPFGTLALMALSRFGKDGILFWKIQNPIDKNSIIEWHEKYILKVCHVMFFIGVIVIAGNLSGRDWYKMIGPAFAVCIIVYLYAYMYICLLQGFKAPIGSFKGFKSETPPDETSKVA